MRYCNICNNQLNKDNKKEYNNLVHFECLLKLNDSYYKIIEELKKQNSIINKEYEIQKKSAKVWENRFQESITQSQQQQKELNICVDDLKNGLVILNNEVEKLKKKNQVLINLFEDCCHVRDNLKLERDDYKRRVENFQLILNRMKQGKGKVG